MTQGPGSRPAPVPIDTPSAMYQALIKRAMRPRQQRILLLASLATFQLFALSLVTWKAWWRACVWISALALIPSAVLPLIFLRRTHLIKGRALASPRPVTRLAFIASLVRADDVWQILGVHAMVGAVVSSVYALTKTHMYGWSTALAPMQYVSVHDAYYINEVCLLSIGMTVLASVVYASLMMYLVPGGRRGVPPFDTTYTGKSLRTRTLASLQSHVPLALLGWLCVPLALGVYLVFRDAFWTAILRIVGIETALRRFVVPSFRVPFSSFRLLVHATPPVLMTLALMEVVHTLFDIYWTHPLRHTTIAAKDLSTVLLGGLMDPHPFFSSHAFCELAWIAEKEPKGRQTLFDDVQRQHGRPIALEAITTACIRMLDHIAKVEEPAAKTVPTSAPSQAAATTTTKPEARSSSKPSNVWHILASDSANSAPTSTPTPSSSSSSSQPQPQPQPLPSFTPPTSTAQRIQAVAHGLWTLMPSEVKHVLFPRAWYAALCQPTPGLWLEAHWLPYRARVCWAAQALQGFVLASLQEDRYGSVQGQVPRVQASLQQAHTRLATVHRYWERTATEADAQWVRDVRVVRGVLADAGTDHSTTLGTSIAPFYNEMQMAWQAYAALDDVIVQATHHIGQVYAPYR